MFENIEYLEEFCPERREVMEELYQLFQDIAMVFSGKAGWQIDEEEQKVVATCWCGQMVFAGPCWGGDADEVWEYLKECDSVTFEAQDGGVLLTAEMSLIERVRIPKGQGHPAGTH